MIAPYAKIGDAHQEAAFLTNKYGYDVAVLSRVLSESVQSDHQTLTDEQWQRVIDLIDAAPDLLKALENMVSCFNANDSDSMTNAVNDAVAVIAKARGGAK